MKTFLSQSIDNGEFREYFINEMTKNGNHSERGAPKNRDAEISSP